MDEILDNNVNDYKKIWDEVKKSLSLEVSALTFDVWIKALEPIGIRGNSIVLSSPSQGAKSVILKNHKDKIERIIQEVSPFYQHLKLKF